MAMRPRTFRRLVLTGVLLGVILLGAIGYFVIAPMQERRTIENLRATGIEAFENGDYAKATQNLRRFLRNTTPRPPTELLTFARAQSKVEVRDAGHLRGAIDAYRSYLVQRPADIEVSQELLEMFNRAAMYPEAKNLAESLRAKTGIDRKLVLTEEILARTELDRKDPGIHGLYEELLAFEDLDFLVIWRYWHWLESTDRVAQAIAFAQSQIEAHPDRPGPKVLLHLSNNAVYRAVIQQNNQAAVRLARQLMEDIGWDLSANQWKANGGVRSSDLADVVAGAFDRLGFSSVSLEVFVSAAESSDDRFTWADAARRLYWAGLDERLLAIENDSTAVLGFQALAARRAGQDDILTARVEQLSAIDTDFRAKAWGFYLDGLNSYEEGRLIEARGLIAEAVETHVLEPMFHQTKGEIYAELGFEEDAIRAWAQADRAAGRGVWAEPSLSMIGSMIQSGHYADAAQRADALMWIGYTSPRIRYVWLQSKAAIARAGMLDSVQIDSVIGVARDFAENTGPEERTSVSLIIAELLALRAEPGDRVAAQDELTRLIASDPDASDMAQIAQLARDYDLGVVDQSLIDTREIALASPDNAFGFTVRNFVRDQDRDAALELYKLGRAQATEQERLEWDIARVRFLDFIRDEGARDEWEELLAANPEDIKLLYAALDSRSIGFDRSFVDSTIAKIMELTSSKGRAEPVRLRLARARAVAYGGNQLTKTKRDEALSIVRSVIATDANHIKARVLLSQLLEAECPADVEAAQRFTPDHAAAAAEKLTISRLIAGPASRNYLLDVSKLNVTLGDDEAARQNLLEAYERSKGNLDVQFEIIQELRRAGEFDLAIPRLRALTQNAEGAQKADFQIVLARMLTGTNNRADMLAVLQSLARSPELTSAQHLQLISLFAQNGYLAEAEQVLSNAARYGLSNDEALNASINFARMRGNYDEAISMLRAKVETDPSDAEAWVQIARIHQQSGSVEQAVAVLEEAIAINPGNELIAYDLSFMRKDPAQLAQIIRSTDYDESLQLAAKQITDFEQQSASMSDSTKISELERIAQTFPNNAAVQGYVYDALLVYGDDPAEIGRGAESASRRFGGHTELLSIAANAYSRAEMWREVIDVCAVWRGVISDAPIEPDIYAARANYEMKNYLVSRELLAPYVENAAQKIDEPQMRELIFNYANTLVKLREPGARIALELEPIARSSESFRNIVWLSIARDELLEADEAVRWIELAEEMSTQETLGMIADAWLVLSKRFPLREDALVDRAVAVSERWMASYPGNPLTLSLTGRVLQRAAALEEQDAAQTQMRERAMSLFDEAASKDPTDLNYLFNAAQLAKDLGDYEGAVSRYERMLGSLEGTGIFGAAVKNNLARVIELSSDDPERLARAAELAQEAIAFQENSAFVNTLGWIELKRGKLEESTRLFRKLVADDPRDINGWAGLAIALNGRDEDGALQAIRRVEQLGSEQELDPIIESQLRRHGVVVQVETEVP